MFHIFIFLFYQFYRKIQFFTIYNYMYILFIMYCNSTCFSYTGCNNNKHLSIYLTFKDWKYWNKSFQETPIPWISCGVAVALSIVQFLLMIARSYCWIIVELPTEWIWLTEYWCRNIWFLRKTARNSISHRLSPQ